MRLEFNGFVLLVCVFLLIFVWALRDNTRCKPYLIFMSGFCSALILPAWVPAHGEIIVALPNAALFTVFNSMAWGVGLFYLVVNFFISYAFLNIMQKYLNSKRV